MRISAARPSSFFRAGACLTENNGEDHDGYGFGVLVTVGAGARGRSSSPRLAEMERMMLQYTSLKSCETPQQIADQIVFICSERGRTISGQAISLCADTQMLG